MIKNVTVKLTEDLVNGYLDKLEELARKYGMSREKLQDQLNRPAIKELLPDAIQEDFLNMIEQEKGEDSRRKKEYYSE